MRALFPRSLTPLTLFILLAPPVFGVGPNRIHDVRLSLQSGNAVVEIAGERAPNFTSFKQDNPRRIIVDVAESDLGNVPDLIRGDGKLVNEISTRRYGRPPHSVSRVVIALNHEAEYRVTSRGGSLFVHVMPGAGGLLVSAGVPLSPEPPPPPPVEEAPPSAPATPPVRPEPSAARPTGAGAPVAAHSAVTRTAAAPAPAPIPPRTTSPESEPVLVAKADAPVAAPPAPPAPAPEPTRTSAVTAAAPRTPVSAGVGATGPAPRPEPIRLAQADDSSEPPPEVEEVTEEPPPPPPEEQGGEAVPPPPPPAEEATPPAPRPAEEATPPPPPPEPVREEEEVPPPPPPPPTQPKPAPREERVIQPEARVEVTSAMKDMTWLGFQQTAEASRVFIKTNEPVRYRVVEEGDDLVVLELENTRIPLRNNRRFLDTHFFNTAVTMITPREIEGVSRNVRVEIQLRHKVPYSATQEDNVVYLRFERPR